jgi:hypothetical protein
VKDKEDIDQLFKDGLLEPDLPFNEQDWEKMSHKLDVQARRRHTPIWLLWGSAVAAILLIFLFWMFLKPAGTKQTPVQNQIAKKEQPQSGKNTQRLDVPANVQEQKVGSKDLFPTNQNAQNRVNRRTLNAGNELITDTSAFQNLNLVDAGQTAINLQPGMEVQPIPFDASINTAIPRTKQSADNYASVVKDVKKKMKANSGKKTSLVLSAMLAPDISYAKSSIASKVSSNAGLLATLGFTPKLSVTTGAIYSNKFYNSNVDGVNAYNASGAVYQVNASCNVLDIPLNVNYKLVDKKVISVSLNTGLSSYLMLKEKYDYIYPQAGASPSIVSYQVRNQNKHILGVANVAISVERKISSNLSIGVQPFMKLPLTGIGVGDANLKSSGLSFSLNMSLGPSKKPGKYAGLRHY